MLALLSESLCKEAVLGVKKYRGRDLLVTAFRYPNGDSVVVYHENGRWTDLGETLFTCRDAGVNAKTKQATIDRACRMSGVTEFDGVLTAPDDSPASLLLLCEAITRVSSLMIDIRRRAVPELRLRVDKVLDESVAPFRPVVRDWHDAAMDPDGIYPVDFLMEGLGREKHIQVVADDRKASLALSVKLKLREFRREFDTLAVVDEDGLPDADLRRLRNDMEVVVGFDANVKRIVEFAKAG